MKRFLKQFALFLSFVVLASSCAPGNSSTTNNTSQSSNKPEGEQNGELINLTFWRPSGGEKEEQFFIDAVAEFNTLNEGKIKVAMDSITRGNSFAYEDKVNVASTSNSLPDILALDGPNVSNYAFSEIIMPLNDYFTEDELSDFVPSIIQQGTYQDKLYALGIIESTVVLFYNTKMFEDAGIKAPETLEEAWTWEEFYEVAKKLNKDGVYGTNLINDKGEWMTYCFEQFWISNNTDIVSDDGKTAEGYLNSPEGIEAAEFIKKMSDEKLFNPDPTPYEFEEGKAATRLTGPWIVPNFENYPDTEWGMTYFPYSKTKTSPSGSWAFGISKDSKNAKESSDFLKFLTSKEKSINLANVTKMPPARKSAFESIEEYNSLPLKVIADQVINISHARPSTPNYPAVTQKFTEALLDIILGSDVKEKLNQAAKEIDNEYKMTYSE